MFIVVKTGSILMIQESSNVKKTRGNSSTHYFLSHTLLKLKFQLSTDLSQKKSNNNQDTKEGNLQDVMILAQ